VLGDEHKNHQDYDGHHERPENIARSLTAHGGQLAFPERYEAMRHVRFTGVPADNARNYQRDYRYSHGSPRQPAQGGATVIHNVIREIIRFLRAGGARFIGR
jgi:hypothetical protein